MNTPATVPGADLGIEQDRTREARVTGAMTGFAREIGALSAFRLESCIHCGICADACHFYIATEDPPVHAHLESRAVQTSLQTRG